MEPMKVVSLDEIAEGLNKAVKPVNVLWHAPDSIAFVARGRKGRSEFHNDPSDEVMYMIRGDMNLHYLTPEGVSSVYKEFYSDEARRTCRKCGHVAPAM